MTIKRNMENKKAIELLRALRGLTVTRYGGGITTLAYISPSQQMRNAADEMERKDRLLAEIDQFLLENKD